MNRLKRIISPIMILLILFSNFQLPYLKSEIDPQVYAAGKDSNILLSAEPMAITALSTVTEAVYSDEEIAALDEAWLTNELILNGNSNEVWEGYDGTIFFGNITGDLNMPVEGPNGSAISWTSTDPAVIALTGTVTRPGNLEGQRGVVLTVTISKGAAEIVKVYYLFVNPLDPTPEEALLRADHEWLDYPTACGDWYTDQVTWNLPLPTLGPNGSTISWASSNPAVVATNGVLSRPSLAQGNTDVVLTATISRGASMSLQSEFTVTIVATASDAESVAMDNEWLSFELVLNGNRADYVNKDLCLPMWGENDSKISWSADSTLIGEYGHVTRPDITQEDEPVEIIITIRKGDASVVKTFNIVIAKARILPLALNFDDFGDNEDSLQFNGKSGIADTVDPYGNSFKAIQFRNERLSSEKGGSVFTGNKLHLEDDMSFSTAFSYKNIYPQSTQGNSGFTFTLQAEAPTAYGQAPDSAGADGITPSLSIAFDRLYGRVNTGGQSGYYTYTDNVAVFYNGINDAESNGRKVTFNSGDQNYDRFEYHNNLVWLEYNGQSKTLEIRVGSTYDNVRPDGPTLKIDNVDLGEIFTSADANLSIEDVQDVYVGFTGSVGDANDKNEIWDWHFMNNWIPIVFGLETFIDASGISLSATNPGDQSSSTVTAYVYGRDGSAAAGVPVVFSSELGSLNSSPVITDASGNASIVLSSVASGPVDVKATAAGGSMALTEVTFALTDEDSVNYDMQWLTDELVLNGNSALNNITKDLYMPLLGRSGSDISWTSSNVDVVTLNGKVNTPSPAEGDQQVVLTATISKDGESAEKVSTTRVFNIVVKVLDEDRVTADSAWLTDQRILKGNDALNNITTALNIPLLGPSGSAINWTSTNAAVVATDGTVTRPTYTQGDKAVTLTATIRMGSVEIVKTYSIMVKALAQTDAEAVAAANVWLTDTMILKDNSSLGNVIGDLNLPASGPRGTTISWTSANTAVVAADGKVSRPTYTQGDKAVKLTATISKGTSFDNKIFYVSVKKLAQTMEEAFLADKAWLNASRTLGNNLSQYAIQNNLLLPASAPNGSSITWTSGMQGVISDSGIVTRWKFLKGYESVTMAATLKLGAYQDTKALVYTVLSTPDTDSPKIKETTPADNSTSVLWGTKEITIVFDEYIAANRIGRPAAWSLKDNIELRGVLTPDFNVRIDKDTLIITLNSYMHAGMHTLVIAKDSIVDMSGNTLGELRLAFSVEQWQFNLIQVISSSPKDGERNIPVKPEISFCYNNSNIVKGSAFDNILLCARGGEAIPVTKSLTGDTVTLGLGTGVELKPATVYEIVIPYGAVQDRFDNTSSGKTIWFCTQNDGSVPEVISSYPLNGQNDVDIHQSIEIYFSDVVDVDYWPDMLTDNNMNAVYTAIEQISGQQKGIRLRPYESLKPNTEYTITLRNNRITNHSGKSMVLDYVMGFKTGANTLNMDKIYPTSTDESRGASLIAPVEIEFSSPIIRNPKSANIRISDSGGNLVAFQLGEKDNRVVLTPDSKLSPSETYTVNIPAGAYKNVSNALNDALKFKFTAAKQLNLDGATFVVKPSPRWLKNELVTFTTEELEKRFKDNGNGIASCTWDFGDGATGNGKRLDHTYKVAKDYQVILTLQDNKGFSYEIKQTVTISDYDPDNVRLGVQPGSHQQLLFSEEGSNSKLFHIMLSYNDGYMLGESIKVLLYKNGGFEKDLGTVTIGRGDKTYTDEFGRSYNDYGTAFFNFHYKGYNYLGTYELLFVYGSLEAGKVVRVPVSIRDSYSNETQTLRVKLYDRDAGSFVDYQHGLTFILDGEEKFARRQWYDDETGYCYMFDGVKRGAHSLKLSVQGNPDVIHGSEYEPVFLWSVLDCATLPVQEIHPGINNVKYGLYMDYGVEPFFIEGAAMPPVLFEFEGNWNGLEPGYYWVKTDTGRLNYISYEPNIRMNPCTTLRPGERLLVRMVSKAGGKSPWVDANVEVIPKPDFGFLPELIINYENGGYVIDIPLNIGGLNGGRIPLLNDVPLLDSDNSFGMGDLKPTLTGRMMTLDGFSLDASSDFAYSKNKEKPKAISTGYEVTATIYGGLACGYDSSAKEWRLYDYYFGLLADGGYYYSKGYLIPKVNIGIDATVTLGSKIGGTFFSRVNDNNERSNSAILYFEPYVEGSIGASIKKLSIEGYVRGSVPTELHIPTGYIETEPNITAGIRAKAYFLEYDILNKEIAREHWDNGKPKVPKNAVAETVKSLMVELGTENPEFTPMSRNYQNRGSQWLAGSQEKPEEKLNADGKISALTRSAISSYEVSAADVTNPQVKDMKDNIYPEAEVQLVQSDDELWMVWTDDNPERSEMNRTQMTYSILKDGLWSEPVWMGQDGTADFSPVAAAVGDGVLMAWQNIKQTMPEDADLVSFIDNSEITVTESVYKADSSDVKLVTLTNDDKLDHSPRLAADGNNALLVWTKSDGLGFTLGSDTEEALPSEKVDRLVFSSWDGSSWSAAAEIEGDLPAVIDSSLTMNGEEGLLLYTLDMDNNLSTDIDREIFSRIYNGSSWGGKRRITVNEVSDSNPKVVCSNGEWFITWHQAGSIMYKAGLEVEIKTDEALNSVQSNYEITMNPGTESQIALVYKHIGDNNARTLSTSFYDIDKDVWSHELLLTEGKGYVRSFSPVFTGDGKLNIAYTQAEIITEIIEGAEYLNPSNKVDLHLLTYTPVHDLALSNQDGLQLSSENPLPGTMVTVSATIRNQGDFAEEATLYLYDGSPDKGKKIGQVTTAPIPARSSTRVEVEWLVPMENRDEYYFYAVVQPDADIIEIDNSNNTINRKILTADIAVEGLKYKNLAKDDYLVTAIVVNKGSRTLSGVKVQLDRGLSGEVLETKELDQLDLGQEQGISFLISSKGLAKDADGKINMTLRALLPAGVEENSTDNNTDEFVLEPAPIIVDRVNPGPGETQVDIKKSLTLSFSMSVEAGTGFDQITLVDDYLNAIEIDKTLEGNTLTAAPKSALDYNTQYTLTIPKEALGDPYGHTMAGPYSLSFVTTTSSPEVVFAYPGDDMNNIALDTDIKMQYNQKVLNGPTYGDIVMYGPDSKEILSSVSLQGEWLYLRPARQLSEETAYSLVIPRGAVKNDKGEAQQEDYALEFTTAKATDPGDADNDSGDPEEEDSDEEQDSKESDAEQPVYKLSRQTSADGSSTAIVDIDQQIILKLSSDDESVVTLDVTNQVKEDETIQVNLTESALKQLMTNKMSLNVVTGKGDVRLPADLIKALVGEGKTPITITIARNNKKVTDTGRVSDGIFDFSIKAGENLVTKFEPGVIVTIPLDKSKVGYAKRIIVCVYDEAAGSWHPVGGAANAVQGSVTFNTGHFSTYAAFETIKHFDDVISSWAKEKVEILASRRLIEGKDNNVFAPDDSITRAEFTAMIVRSLYTELSKNKGTFEDIQEAAWFAASVETAYEKGLVSGSGQSKFDPNSEISREQLAAIAYRLYQYKAGTKAIDKTSITFKDRQDISSYAEEAVSFVADTKIMVGSGGRFEPGRSATRQEAAVVLYRLLAYMGEL